MSSLVSSALATRLLPLASEVEVVDLLMESASVGTVGHGVANFKGVWSAQVAGKFFKGPLDKACAVARHPRTDPSVLERFAKDPRVSVRHALLDNPSTPYAAVMSLGPWAIERQDAAAVPAVLSRATPEDVVSLLEGMDPHVRGALSHYNSSWIPARVVARKVLATAETALKAASLSWFPLADALMRRHQRMASPPVSITELVTAMPVEHRPEVIVRLLLHCSVLTEEIASLARDVLAADPYWLNHASMGDSVTLVEPESLPVLGAISPQLLDFAIANGLPEENVLELMSQGSHQNIMVVVMSMSGQRRFSAEAEKAIAQHVVALGGDLEIARAGNSGNQLVGAFIGHARHRLPGDLALALLRNGSVPSTRTWLGLPAARANAPVPGQLTNLLHHPGNAFSTVRATSPAWGSSRDYETVTEDPVSWMVRLLRLRNSWTWAMPATSESFREEVITVTDSLLVENLATGSVADLVMPILERSFGSNRHQWETFLSLAEGWTSGLRDLMEATASLTGIDLITPTVDRPVVPVPASQPELSVA